MNKISPQFNTYNICKTNDNKLTKQQAAASNVAENTNTITQKPLKSMNECSINFTGLNRNLSKLAYETGKAIKAEVANFPKSNGIVGNLPAEWIQKTPKENRELSIKGLHQDLKEIVNNFRMENYNTEPASKKINEALIKAGIINKGEKVWVKWIDSGGYGCAFHLKGIFDNKYMIKVFKPMDKISNLHGKYTELNRAAFRQKNAGKNTQMVPFYFGDTDAGYMVNKYIDTNTPKYKKIISPAIYGLKSDDVCYEETGLNKINGFQIDYGGMRITESSLVRNKEKQAEFRRFLALPTENQLAELPKADDRLKTLLIDELHWLPQDKIDPFFKQLIENADDEIKGKLADKLNCLPYEKKAEFFNQLANDASNEVKMKLSSNFFCIHGKDRANCFKQLAKDASDEVKMSLTFVLHYIPPKDRAECYKLLAENASIEVKNKITEKLYNMPKNEKKEIEKLLFGEAPSGFFTSILSKFTKRKA